MDIRKGNKYYNIIIKLYNECFDDPEELKSEWIEQLCDMNKMKIVGYIVGGELIG